MKTISLLAVFFCVTAWGESSLPPSLLLPPPPSGAAVAGDVWVTESCNTDGTCIERNTRTGEKRVKQPSQAATPVLTPAQEATLGTGTISSGAQLIDVIDIAGVSGAETVIIQIGNLDGAPGRGSCPPCIKLDAELTNSPLGSDPNVLIYDINWFKIKPEFQRYLKKLGMGNRFPHVLIVRPNAQGGWTEFRPKSLPAGATIDDIETAVDGLNALPPPEKK